MDKHSMNPGVQSVKGIDFNFETFNDIYFRRFISGMLILIIVGLGLAGFKINHIRTRGYEVFIGESSLGYVRDNRVAAALITDYNRTLTNTYNLEISFEEPLRFVETSVKDELLTTTTELNRNIREGAGFLVSAYTLKIDGQKIGQVKSEEEARQILAEIKAPYEKIEDENSKLVEIDILEDVELENSTIKVEELTEHEELVEYIKTGGQERNIHTIEVGESYWTVAKIYDMEVDDLIEENPGIEDKELKAGDEIIVSVPAAIATVVSTEEVLSSKKIDYETIIEEDSSMFKDEKKVKIKGKAGEAKIISQETKHNGEVVETSILSEEVIKEPVDKVVIQGTKKRPKTTASGSFMVPTRGRVSSGYGRRWGRMHQGIDYAAPTGTPIKASDGGRVTKAMSHPTYGLMVEINHENGYVTRYAHASKLHVKAGTRVYKGQHIANVGNTGRSTGPHLHFEVIANGSHRNPSGYIK